MKVWKVVGPKVLAMEDVQGELSPDYVKIKVLGL